MTEPSTTAASRDRLTGGPGLRRLALGIACVLGVSAHPQPTHAAKRTKTKITRDFHEVVVQDFEAPLGNDVTLDDDRATRDKENANATRGQGCLSINLTAEGPVAFDFLLPADDVGDHDWLEYDIVGAPPGGVLIETTLSVDETKEEFAHTAAVVEGSPWVGQLLLSQLAAGRRDRDLRVAFQLTALGQKVSVQFDALRLVRDNPPKLAPDSGGAFGFGQQRSPRWPGFESIDASMLRGGDDRWMWDGLRPPRIIDLGWPDPLARELLCAGSPDLQDMTFSLSLRCRPGQYEGMILSAPIMQHGLKRAEFGLRCNGWELTARHWRPERMFSEDGIFAGRTMRDFGAEAVHRLWVDQTFRQLRFSGPNQTSRVTIDSLGTLVGGLVVYPRSHRKAFQPYLESLVARRKAYFAQQVYSCIYPTLPGPLKSPTEAEQKCGMQLLKANPLELPTIEFEPTQDHLLRERMELFGLAGQTVIAGIGVLALRDLEGLDVRVTRSKRGSGRVAEIREFPVTWRPPLRRALPLWLAEMSPQPLKQGRIAWYLLEVDVPKAVKGKDLAVEVRVAAGKGAAVTVEVRVKVASGRWPPGEICHGVVYPHGFESGYFLDLINVSTTTDVEALLLGDYRVLSDHGVAATLLRGIYLGDSDGGPRIFTRQALRRARTASRAGLCADVPGWVDFGDLVRDRDWQNVQDGRVRQVALRASRQLHADLGRMNVRCSALLTDQLGARGRPEASALQDVLALARVCRQSGWRSVGVMLDPRLAGLDANVGPAAVGAAAAEGDLTKLLGQIDRLVAPAPLAEALRKQLPKATVELFDPWADRFSSGFRLWLRGFSGVWTTNVHRATIPYLPMNSVRPTQQPLLMPFPRQPAPTLRLLGIREGVIDLAYARMLASLLKRRSSKKRALDEPKQALEILRQQVSDDWKEAVETAKDREFAGETKGRDFATTPSHVLMDKYRRTLFDQIVKLTRRR